MIMSLSWNDNTNMLAALADGKLTVWYYPSAVYVDRDLLPKTVFEKEARYVFSNFCFVFYLYFFFRKSGHIVFTTANMMKLLL